jgi:hypothetical protein
MERVALLKSSPPEFSALLLAAIHAFMSRLWYT